MTYDKPDLDEIDRLNLRLKSCAEEMERAAVILQSLTHPPVSGIYARIYESAREIRYLLIDHVAMPPPADPFSEA